MSEMLDGFVQTAVHSWNQGIELVDKLFAVAQPGAVFSKPLAVDDRTVITASEVMVGIGFGYGAGGGTGLESAEEAGEGQAQGDVDESSGAGSGGGAGGFSGGRPVAVISVGPEGVQVEPVFDVTKITLAFFTAFGSMLFMLARMRRAARD